MTPKTSGENARLHWRLRAGIALIVAMVLVLATALIAVAETDGTGRAVGYWAMYDEAVSKTQQPYMPYTPKPVDDGDIALIRWDACDKARTPNPYAPYTNYTCDETGRALGYWENYEKSCTP